jgi:hypothetical protein
MEKKTVKVEQKSRCTSEMQQSAKVASMYACDTGFVRA